ncbi:DUF4254 domain-containing protein [Nocardia sp. 004]|uniref:DUF4254 domain-containing protein n=1 Tax=Nocardia sp. 004 TaxID=3385978 RepID=UPI0039A255DA
MEPLPSKELLLRACRSTPRRDHPILASAHRLAELHERRLHAQSPEHGPRAEPANTHDIDRHRAQLVLAIDRWVATETPLPHGGAHMHTETMGMVIDRLAQFSVSAYGTPPGIPAWATHDAWERLAELALGYQDLACEIATGQRRLPYLSGPRDQP